MVIQRWQTVLLLLSVCMGALFSFCSLGQIQGANQTFNILSYGIYAEPAGKILVGTVYVTVLGVLAALLSLIGVFMYKNTKLQKRLCMFTLLLYVTGACCEWIALQGLGIAGMTGVSYSSIAFAPFVGMLLVIGAYRCIRSDERKLSAADRLR